MFEVCKNSLESDTLPGFGFGVCSQPNHGASGK